MKRDKFSDDIRALLVLRLSWSSIGFRLPQATDGGFLSSVSMRSITAFGRMLPAVPLLQPSAAGLRGNLRNYTPGSAADRLSTVTPVPSGGASSRCPVRSRAGWHQIRPGLPNDIFDPMQSSAVSNVFDRILRNRQRTGHQPFRRRPAGTVRLTCPRGSSIKKELPLNVLFQICSSGPIFLLGFVGSC
jgi:hypothetical protein